MKKKIIIIAACVLAAIIIGLVVWAALANGWFVSVPDMDSLEVSDITFDTALVKWESSGKDAELEIHCKAKNGTVVFNGTVEDSGEFLLEGLEHGTEYSVRAVYFEDEHEGEPQRVSFETEYNPAADVYISYVDFWYEGAADVCLDWWYNCEDADSYLVRYKAEGSTDWEATVETVNPECTLPLMPGSDYEIEVVPLVEGYEGEVYSFVVYVDDLYIYVDYWIDEGVCELYWDGYSDLTYTVSCSDGCFETFETNESYVELELTPEMTHTVHVGVCKNDVEFAGWTGDIEMPALPEILEGYLSAIDAWTAELHLTAKGTQDSAWWDMEIKNGQYTEDSVYFDYGETETAVEIYAIPGTTLTVIVDGKEFSIDMPQAEPFTDWTFERISFYAEPDYSGWDGNDLEELGTQTEFTVGQAMAAQMFIDAGGTDYYTRYFDQKMIVHRPDGTCVVVSDYENSVDGDWESWHTWFNSSVMGNTDVAGTYCVYVYIDGLLAGSGSYTVS